METTNKELLNSEQNREYYAKSDGNFMDPNMCTKAHLVLDRVNWVREKVHGLDSKYHLDVGTKDGYTCLTLAAEGVECVGIDPSWDAIVEAHTRALERDLEVTFQQKFLEDMPAGFVFDTVSMMEVLEHVVDADVAVKKLAELGHYVLITTPDADGKHGMLDSEQNMEHVRLYTKEELETLCAKYGAIRECVKRDDALYILFESKLYS